MFDRFLLLLFAVFWVPILFLLSILVLFFSGRPVFFVQERVGLNGEQFLLYKFRSMTVDKSASNGSFDAGSSARVTKLGKIMRKTKLDELPQLINVLKGDMSIVGPRPEVRKWVEAYPERWCKVHTIRPGITDPASIVYRNEERILSLSNNPEDVYRNDILPHKLDLYEKYVQSRSFLGNLKIIVLTFKALFR